MENTQTLPADFGKGWLTNNAADLFRIAVAFGGFDAKELTMRLYRIRPDNGRLINMATVERALGEIRKEAQ